MEGQVDGADLDEALVEVLSKEVAELRERLLALDPLKEALHMAQQEITRLMSTTVVERDLAATVDELRDQVRERDGVIADLRADLARYTAIYADPDTPVDVSGFGVGEPDVPPLFPFMAEMADRVAASKPEPAPRAGGELVTPRVLAWLATQAVNVGDEAVARAVALVRARDAFGRLKYEQGLSFGDGRDTVEDLRQELGDALQYGVKALAEGVEGERLEELRDLAQLLWLLMCADNVGGAR